MKEIKSVIKKIAVTNNMSEIEVARSYLMNAERRQKEDAMLQITDPPELQSDKLLD